MALTSDFGARHEEHAHEDCKVHAGNSLDWDIRALPSTGVICST